MSLPAPVKAVHPLSVVTNSSTMPRNFSCAYRRLPEGVFGMNLLSGWEEKPHAFWQVTGGIYGCILLSIVGTLALCRRLSLL